MKKNEKMSFSDRLGGQETNITPINKGNKKRKIVTGILGVVLMVLLIGVSYAVWKYTFTGETNVIDTGEVSIEFLESTDVISIENALPITDEQGITQTEEFDFAVTTKTGKEMDIGYSLYLEKIQTKCSEIESPTQETYPSCYFTISEEDKKALIEWMASLGEFGSTTDESTQFYDAIVAHDKETLQSLYIEIYDLSYSEASDFVNEYESNGYEEILIGVYQQLTGKTITVNNEFNENNIAEPSKYLDDSEVKIYLTDNEGSVLVGPTRVSNLLDGYLLHNDINEHNAFNRVQTDRYKIRIWVDSETDASNWDENTKLEYKFKIGVKTPQRELTTTMLMPGLDFNNLMKRPFDVGEVRFITSAKNINTSNAIDNAVYAVYDVSDAQDGSITAWVEERQAVTYDLTPGILILYIATEKDILFANPDSANMFYRFTGLQIINADKLNVSTVENMDRMFYKTNYLTSLDLSTWDTSKVTSSKEMFCESGVTQDTLVTGPKWTLTTMFDGCVVD